MTEYKSDVCKFKKMDGSRGFQTGSLLATVIVLGIQILCYVAPYWLHQGPGKTLGLWAECLSGRTCTWSLHTFCPVFSRVALSINLGATLAGVVLVMVSLARGWSARLFYWSGGCLVLAGISGATGAVAWVSHYLLPASSPRAGDTYKLYWGVYVVLAACVCDIIAGVVFLHTGRKLQSWHETWTTQSSKA